MREFQAAGALYH